MKPLVSIIIPNYNKGRLVRHSLDSLIRQTSGDWEAIVVDDCSTDSSWDFIQEYVAKDERIKVYRNEANRGGNYSRNFGAKKAQGKYLIFLDSDDWLEDDCIENRVEEFEKGTNRDVDLLVFNMMSTRDGKSSSIWKYGDRRNPLVSFLRHGIPWSIMMPIWRKSAFERIGGFDEALPRLQDVELHTRALIKGLRYRFAQRESPDCFYNIEEARMTTNHAKAAENFVKACGMYVPNMCRLIQESNKSESEKVVLMNALQETCMAAISGIGNMYQRGVVDKIARNAYYSDILSINGGGYVSCYAFLYKLWINKIKGFNFFYRKFVRFMQGANFVFCSRR